MSVTRDTVAGELGEVASRTGRRLSLKKAGLLAAAIVFGAAAIAFGAHWWTVDRFIETTDDAYVGGNVTEIAPHISGFISEIAVADNQYASMYSSVCANGGQGMGPCSNGFDKALTLGDQVFDALACAVLRHRAGVMPMRCLKTRWNAASDR